MNLLEQMHKYKPLITITVAQDGRYLMMGGPGTCHKLTGDGTMQQQSWRERKRERKRMFSA